MITLFYALCLYGAQACGPMGTFPGSFATLADCQDFIREFILTVQQTPPREPWRGYRFACKATT